MEITANVRLSYKDSGLFDQLNLVVEFKLPTNFFKIKREKVLCDAWWIGEGDDYKYKSHNEYQDDLIAWTSYKELIIKEAEKLVKDYISGEAKDIKESNKKKLFKKQLSEIGKIEIKVKID